MGVLQERRPGMPLLLRNRQSQSEPSTGEGFTTILLPVLVVGGVILLVSIGMFFRRKLRREAAAAAGTTAAATPIVQVAERRARRNRRRASQISTKSLPMYMEDAGEEEVVLVSRQRELLPVVSEDTVRPSMDSGDSVPDEHASTPLLERDPHSMPFSTAGLSPSQAQLDSGASAQFSSTIDLNDDRGEAPAYFEVVAADAAPAVSGESPAPSPPQVVPAAGNSPDSADQSHNRRQSIFRTFFNRNNEQNPSANPDNGSTTARGHRTSTSISSLRPLSLHRTRSGESTDQSQSTIPLRNISAPLHHTLVRTEFTFPKAGPTEQQIKFLSSRESLGRFGLPYGEEARAEPPAFDVAVGASSSRISLGLGHGRNGSLASTLSIPTTDQTHSASTANLRVTDSSPPESPSADLAIQRVVEPESMDLVQPVLPDIITSLPPNGHARLPRRMSTIHSAVEPPDSVPTSPQGDRTSRQRLSTASAANRASLTA